MFVAWFVFVFVIVFVCVIMAGIVTVTVVRGHGFHHDRSNNYYIVILAVYVNAYK